MTDENGTAVAVIDKRAGADLVVSDHRAAAVLRPETLPETEQIRSEAGGLLLQAMARGLPTEQLALFLDHHRDHVQTENRARYAAALAKAQGEYGTPVKVAKSDRGRYAPMDQDVAAIRDANAKHGISYFHRVKSTVIAESNPPAAVVTVQCIVRHEGHDEAHPPMETIAAEIPGQRGPQMTLIRAIKSAATFLRRLTLESAFGLAPENDDDGQGIGPRAQQQQRQQSESAAPRQEASAPTHEDRVKRTAQVFRGFRLLLEDLERGLGKPAADWTDEDFKQLTTWRTAFKNASRDRQDQLAKELGMLEPGATG
jgi:hypothetical protein